MKYQTVALLASLLSLGVAAPVAECVAKTTSSCTVITTTITTTFSPSACVAAPTAAAEANNAILTAAVITEVNVQVFTGTLGGPPPPVISGTGTRPFTVNGATFVGQAAALGRSCDVQHNACANAANSGQLSGGVAACDQQNNECRSQISSVASKRALNLGSCSDTTIVFQVGLDGRSGAAFIASNQRDFNHGSALKIGVIADFICQRLASSCRAPADAIAACAAASAAAVAATQDQAAADAFNSVMGGTGAVAAPATTAAATQAVAAVQTGIVVQTITSCT